MGALPQREARTAAQFWDARPSVTVGTATGAATDRQALLEELAGRYGGTGRVGRRALASGQARVRWRLATASGRWAKRLVDVLASGTVLAAASPLVLVGLAVARARFGRALAADERVGLQGRAVRVPRLFRPAGGERALAPSALHRAVDAVLRLWPVLRGELSLVGPRAVHPEELAAMGVAQRRRLDVPPGLVSLHRARQLANLAHEDEAVIEDEYLEAQSPRSDLRILATAVVGRLLQRGGERAAPAAEVPVLGVPVANLRMVEVVDRLLSWVEGGRPRFVAFLNAHCGNVACEVPAYRAALNGADLVLADGVGLRLAGAILGQPIRENVNGTDLVPRLCARLEGRRVYLLGAAPGVAEEVGRRLQASFPGLVVAGARSGFFEPAQEEAVADAVAASGADVLLVAMGVPRQELFIARHLARLNVPVVLAVGGLFDFIAGRVPRAPLWMRELGVEWVYRLAQEPGRMWRRYLVGNFTFVTRVAWARLSTATASPRS